LYFNHGRNFANNIGGTKSTMDFFLPWRKAPSGPWPPHYRGFMITLRHTTFCRTPLDEWSTRSRDLYLTTHKTHKKQTSMPPAGFEPAIPASERPQTEALDGAATGTGTLDVRNINLQRSKVRKREHIGL